MKILLMSPLPPPCGGISTWTRSILDFFSTDAGGYEIIHLNTSSKSREITKEGMLYKIFHGTSDSLQIIKELKNNIRLYSPDVIHLTSSASLALIKDYFIIRIAKRNSIPVVVHWRFGRIPELAFRKNWEWKLLRKIVTESSQSIVIDDKSFNCLINNGVRNVVKIPNPAVNGVAGLLDQRTGDIIRKRGAVLYVGHLIKSKGLYELVEACSLLPEVQELILVGPGEDKIKKELSELAGQRRNDGWLSLTGPADKEQVYKNMLSSTLLVLPSYTEGFPNVVIEAMSAGCPVVATDVGAIPEILAVSSENPCGICIPAKDTHKLRDAISSLLNDQEKSEIMGLNGKISVLKNYAMTVVVKQYESLWNKFQSS